MERKKSFHNRTYWFKGSWLTYILNELGAEVKGYSLPLEEDKILFRGLNLVERIDTVSGDINDYDQIHNEINNFDQEILFHLAAQPLVRRSYSNPKKTLKTNILGTHLMF